MAGAWLAAALAALSALFAVWTGYLIWALLAPLGYTGLMGLYLAMAACALFLGIEGWRRAALPLPPRRSGGCPKAVWNLTCP